MKLLCLLIFVLVEGSVTSNETPNNENKTALRIVTEIFSDVAEGIFTDMQSLIISNCNRSGHHEKATNLEETIYPKTKTCIEKKEIFSTNRSEFITNFKNCSENVVVTAKECLGEKQKYFPEFIQELVKSLTNFLYDDRDFNNTQDKIELCMRRLKNEPKQEKYISVMNCIQPYYYIDNIPESEAEFCKTLISSTNSTVYCLTDMLKNKCDYTGGYNKFRDDYINAIKQPCQVSSTASATEATTPTERTTTPTERTTTSTDATTSTKAPKNASGSSLRRLMEPANIMFCIGFLLLR